MSPVYHTVCSSAFIEPIWLRQLELKKPTSIYMYDWRLMSLGYFQSVGALCQLAHDTVTYNLEFFLERTLFTVRLVSEMTLRNEIDQASKELISSMQTEFQRTVNILQILFQVNQYYSVFNGNGYLYLPRPNDDGKLEVSFAQARRLVG